jgi:hypothetical protein
MNTSTDTRFDDENIKQAIQQLIIDESDPKEKLRLLMLLQLNSSLVANVVAVRNLTTEFKEHRTEFDSHVKAEEKLMNTGRGSIWSVIALIGFIQAVSGYVFTQHMSRFDQMSAIAVEAHDDNVAQTERIKNLDEKFNRVVDKLDKVITSSGK